MAIDYEPLELKLARIRAGIKQKELAAEIGIRADRLCFIESGRRKAHPAEVKIILAILKRHGVELPAFVQEAEQ